MTDDSSVPPEDDTDPGTVDLDDTVIPDDAFISPDAPIVRREQEAVPEDAFISPDAPFERSNEPSMGTVVGMSGSARHASPTKSIHLDPNSVAQILEDTARRIRDDGIGAGLAVGLGAPRFEVMLKAYLAGYFSTR